MSFSIETVVVLLAKKSFYNIGYSVTVVMF